MVRRQLTVAGTAFLISFGIVSYAPAQNIDGAQLTGDTIEEPRGAPDAEPVSAGLPVTFLVGRSVSPAMMDAIESSIVDAGCPVSRNSYAIPGAIRVEVGSAGATFLEPNDAGVYALEKCK